ncbi:uncharacterized protein [Cherax quadricarinatus]|uniref:uncharacterized protein isoform X3 n=1 Tax=Cherax quadricarinatus TaxID=27406 RepID=UPI00387EE312
MKSCVVSLARVLVVVMVVRAEKLGNIEVITRGELNEDGLTPGTRSLLVSAGEPSLVVQNDPAPPPISYLPPVQTPLPIEPTGAPSAVVTPGGLYQPPETPTVVQTPAQPLTSLYDPPNQEVFAGGDNTPVAVGAIGENISPGVPASDIGGYDNSYDEVTDEPESGTDGFFSNLRNSKFALLGGVLGAKTAVAQGFRNAQQSFLSGITSAVASKSAAISSLKSGSSLAQDSYENDDDTPNEEQYQGGYDRVKYQGNYGGGQYQGNYGNGQYQGNYGSGQYQGNYGSGSDGGSGIVKPVDPAPLPVNSYPIFPPYPQPVYPKPFYPLAIYPVGLGYHPKSNPFASIQAKVDGIKAKVAGIAQAKAEAVATTIAKIEAAKAGITNKFLAGFQKSLEPYSAKINYSAYPPKPNYPTFQVKSTKPNYQTYPINLTSPINPTNSNYPTRSSYLVYSTNPTYPLSQGGLDAMIYPRLKAPYYTIQPVYLHSYGRRQLWLDLKFL